MSCVIIYKGKKYSEEQFKEYFINNKQEFATSIAKNKDVIDSFKRKMEGIEYVFSQSPELASIGSKAQYLQYLSTIFPDSKVKDIVYHGTKTKFDKFEKRKSRFSNDGALLGRDTIMFTDDRKIATRYSEVMSGTDIINEDGFSVIYGEVFPFEELTYPLTELQKEKLKKYFIENEYVNPDETLNNFENYIHKTGQFVISAILNIKNISIIDANKEQKPISFFKDHRNKSIDGIFLNDVLDPDLTNLLVVFEPEQIHILGSKQDIEGFKNWVSSTPQSTNVDENPNQTHIDKINAKYDAELKALGQQQENLQKEENKRQEIKRQEEELNRLIAIEEAQKEQEKAAEAEAEKQQKLRDLHNDVSFSLGFFETAVKDLSFHIEDLVDLSEIELNIEKLKTKIKTRQSQ